MSGAEQTPTELAQACQNGDRRAASRLISLIEAADAASSTKLSEALAGFALPRQTIGITGPPGAGKSTLLDYAVSLYRARGEKVAVLAIDPSSPFTGGALLGDRIRMSSLRNDAGVFIRSMGSRGAPGGIAAAASDALRVLSAAGYPVVFLETVGAGQTETEIINLADTVCVVQVPGLGDDVQLMKMGVLEIADIFIVNKGDKPEAVELKIQLELAIQNATSEPGRALRQLGGPFSVSFSGARWTPPVILLSALQRSGGEALLDACDVHLDFLRQPGLHEALQRSRMMRELIWRAGIKLKARLGEALAPGGEQASIVDACARGELTIEQALTRLL
ncbi:MAG TPA: methylmalonyl Co-A mutase-associated GTPase MeaB [Planctomycetota bacterium]|nr:methylmalonyl Co-A mutase-associated GTPase MeaB [Planctomycetota bacterium]